MKKLLSEFLGTALLVAIVIGSGIMATDLSSDIGVQLLINTVATLLGLAVLIQTLGPISGAHFNPVVSLIEFMSRRLSGAKFIQYGLMQVSGAVTGALLANATFDHPLIESATKVRSGSHLYLGEIVATAGLIMIINLLFHQGTSNLAAWVVPAWIGSAYFFTSSTSFANPAVTIGRMFSDSFAGISPNCVPQFIGAQFIGALIGIAVVRILTNDN